MRLLTRDQWLVFSAFLLWGIGSGLWFQFQPLYIEMLGADPKQVGAALGLPGIAVVFLYIPMGLLADRMKRRKPIIVAAWATGTVSTLLMAIAPNWQWVIPGLALNLFSSFSRPIIGAYIAGTDRQGNLGRLFALLSVGWSAGSIIGPALGGWFAEMWGLRSVFYIAIGFNLLSTGAILLLREDPQPAPTDQARKPAVGRLLADRPLMWQMFVFLLIVFAFELGTLLTPSFLFDVKGLSLQQIGQMGTVASVGLMAFNVGVGQMRSERRLPFLLIQLAVAGGLALLLAAPNQASNVLFFPLLFVGYFGRGAVEVIWPVSRSRVAMWVPPEMLSLGFAFMDTASQVARTIAPFLAGQLYDRSPALPIYAGLIALGVTLALTFTLPHKRPAVLAEAPAVQA